jgi:hypothetical protein
LLAFELLTRLDARINNLERTMENEFSTLKVENSHLSTCLKQVKEETLEASNSYRQTNDQILEEERKCADLLEECSFKVPDRVRKIKEIYLLKINNYEWSEIKQKSVRKLLMILKYK